MNAGECRRKAQCFLTLSRQMSRPKDRAAMVEMAALWMGRADQAERIDRQQKPYEQLAKKTDE
jgi:hypothetical protein